LESEIEKKVCEYAKSQGWLTFKFTSPGNRHVPDRIFIKDSAVFFVEFKRKNLCPTKAQHQLACKIRSHNIEVYVVDCFDSGKELIHSFTA